jgi:excisionase family DNA binding protein
MSAPARVLTPDLPVVSTPWLTPEEAAAYLRLPSVRALYQAVRRGQVPVHRRANKAMLFNRGELDAAMLAR